MHVYAQTLFCRNKYQKALFNYRNSEMQISLSHIFQSSLKKKKKKTVLQQKYCRDQFDVCSCILWAMGAMSTEIIISRRQAVQHPSTIKQTGVCVSFKKWSATCSIAVCVYMYVYICVSVCMSVSVWKRKRELFS